MKKVYKFLLLLFLPILILSCVVIPTYCIDISSLYYSIDRVSVVDIKDFGNNYYNGQNTNYVYLENFNLIPTGVSQGSNRAIYFETSEVFNSLYNIPSFSYSEDVYFNYYNEKYLIGTLTRHFSSTYNGKAFILYFSDFNFVPNLSLDYSNCRLGLSNSAWSDIEISVSSFPFSIYSTYFHSIRSFKNCHIYTPFSIQFDINFTNQYYYNNQFGFTFGYREPFQYEFINASLPVSFTQFYNISDINNNTFKYINNSYNVSLADDSIYLLTNNFNYENVLYKTIYCGNSHGNWNIGDISSDYFMTEYYTQHHYTFSHSASGYVEGIILQLYLVLILLVKIQLLLR